MNEILQKCNLCPRNCGINRYLKKGVCGADYEVKVAHYCLHMWEEPFISGDKGSGAIFFSNCNLKCIFCQNSTISEQGYGKGISTKRLSELYIELQEKGAHNINLVTPTHYVPQIIESLKVKKDKKLVIPIIYNTSSYENVETIKLLDGYVDIYLADLKYFDNTLGEKYSHCNKYFDFASKAIDEMYKQVGIPNIVDGLLNKGLVVRVLVLPGHTDDAKKIIEYLYTKYGDNIYISIMNQYTPIKKFDEYKNLNSKLPDEEYDDVVDFACTLGVTNAFIQEGETCSESFIPKFNCEEI